MKISKKEIMIQTKSVLNHFQRESQEQIKQSYILTTSKQKKRLILKYMVEKKIEVIIIKHIKVCMEIKFDKFQRKKEKKRIIIIILNNTRRQYFWRLKATRLYG